jgi:lysophospholipase L1-like esterase
VLKNKKLSILGDSISSYKGVSDDRTANSTLVYNAYYYKEPFPKEKTYWHLVMERFGLELCVNNSYSGGNLSGNDDPDAGVNRVRELSRDDGTDPDIIIVFMGINDLGRQVSADVFYEDYKSALMTIARRYPDAYVCCVNLPDRDKVLRARCSEFNEKIADAARCAGENFLIADLFGSCMNNDFYYMNTLDGLHPDEDGMKHIAKVVIDALRSRIDVP